jgi:hypothetical protein
MGLRVRRQGEVEIERSCEPGKVDRTSQVVRTSRYRRREVLERVLSRSEWWRMRGKVGDRTGGRRDGGSGSESRQVVESSSFPPGLGGLVVFLLLIALVHEDGLAVDRRVEDVP